MSNSWFNFKHFTIHQEKTAMKVCTDACLFGAWVANKIAGEKIKIERILDVGAGTGLLSLMLAQKSEATIDAVEIDEAAATQTRENFEQAKYKERLRLIHTDIRKFNIDEEYNLVISNPPFFNNDLKSKHPQRNVALHSEHLNFQELIQATKAALQPQGIFAVLVPFSRSQAFISLAKTYHLFPHEEVSVQQTEKHPSFRSILLFTAEESKCNHSKIIIKENQQYSAEFVRLLKDYYLFL